MGHSRLLFFILFGVAAIVAGFAALQSVYATDRYVCDMGDYSMCRNNTNFGTCEDCTANNGWYCNGNTAEQRSYSCLYASCGNYTVDFSVDCAAVTADCNTADTTCRDYDQVPQTCGSGKCVAGACSGYTDAAMGTSCGTNLVCNGSGACVAAANCTGPDGSTINHGSSGTYYQNSSVPYGSSCVSETRTCNNGLLSGSYTNASCSVGLDTTPPSSTLSVVPSTVDVGATISITVSATDTGSGVSVLSYYDVAAISWTYYFCTGNPSSCSNTFTTSQSSAGSYSYYGYAKNGDGYGAYTTPFSATITVAVSDNTPPSTSITSVAGDTGSPYWDTSNNNVTAIVISGESGMSCRWSDSDLAYNSISSALDCSISGSAATCTIPTTSETAYQRYVSCKDSAGNQQSTSQNLDVSFGVDWTAPSSSITGPTGGSWQGSSGLTVSATDTDTGGSLINTCYYGVYSPEGITGLWTVPLGTARTTCGSVPAITVGSTGNCRNEGENKCYVEVSSYDGAGTPSLVSSRTFSVDFHAPVVGQIPTTSAVAGAAVTLSTAVYDAGGSGFKNNVCKLYIGGADKGDMALSGSAPITASVDYTFALAGTYNDVHVLCEDNAGNSASGADQTITVTSPASISVTPSSLSFGDVGVGSSSSKDFTVKNTGGGTLSGSVSGLAAPFSCQSGCSYSLAANAAQTTTIKFSPTAVGSFSTTAVFSGGAGYSGSVSGAGVPPSLTYPSGTWQRLWYTTSGSSPNVSLSTFLGEGPGSNDKNGIAPDVTSVSLSTDWGDKQLYNTTASGTENGKSKIGFRMSRKIWFDSADLYKFTVGSDDGAKLMIDPDTYTLPVIDQWSNGSYRTSQTNRAITTAGYHNFVIEYYENDGNARVSFSYALADTCSAPQGTLILETQPDSIRIQWDRVSGATAYKAKWGVVSGGDVAYINSTTIVDANCGASKCEATATGLSPSTTYYFDLRVETDSNTLCNAPSNWTGPWPALGATTSSCAKTMARRFNTFQVPLSNGESCGVTITHFGRDVSDAGEEQNNVRYESVDSNADNIGTDFNKIAMDDNANSGCENNLKFTNEWTPGTGTLSVKSIKNEYGTWLHPTTHDLEYGYKLTAGSNCMFSSFTQQSCTKGNWQSPTCNVPSISTNKKSVESWQPWQPNLSIPWLVESAQYQYAVVPDNPPAINKNTAPDQWKNANPTLDIDFADEVALSSVEYKVGSSGTWRAPSTDGVSNADGTTKNPISVSGVASYTSAWKITNSDWDAMPQGDNTIYFRAQDTSGKKNGYDDSQFLTIKKDTLVPSSTLNVAGAKTGTDSAGRHWLNAGKSISVEDKDNETPGVGKFSGLDTTKCYYKIQDLGRAEGPGNPTSGFRTCGSAVSVTIGSSATGAICQTQGLDPITGRGYCYLYVQSYDLAGNSGAQEQRLNIDYTPPGAQ